MMTDIPRKRARTNCVYECRACLVNIDDDSGCVDIFCAWDPPWSGMGVSIAQDLNKLSNVQISDSDTHSKKICIKCCSRLQEALDFKLSVQKNDLLLRRRHSEAGDENPLWPKPIQVDKNIAANTLNAMAVEVKEELLSENEYEMNEPCSELSEPNLDIKIEPEEMTPVAIPSVESEVDGLCSNSRPAIKEVKTNGATEFLDERLPEEVKEELMSEEEAEPVADMPMDCMLCFERFNTVKGLKAHVIAVHSYSSFPSPRAEVPNACTQCDRGFTTLAQLSTHEACHSSFKCYVCGNKFPTSFLLDNHRNKCERTSALSRLETLEDVKRPISVYYIIDKMSSQNKDSRSGSPENLEKLSFLEPLDPKKYKIIQEEEDLPLEPLASRHSTVKVYPSAKKLASKFKSSEVISKTINEPEKVSSYEETFIINIIKYDRTSEGNTGKQQESINMDTSAMKDQSDPESKLAEGLKQVKESVEVSHSNDLALKSKSNNEESSYKIQDKSSEVSNTIKENAASVDSYNTKENESVVVDKICGVSDKMNNIKSVERNIFELCNRIREKVINNQSTLNEDSQKCNEMDEYKESSIPEICNKTKELVVDTLETTPNEESNKMDMTSKESTIPEVCNKTKERVVNTIASKLNENVQKSNKMDIISEESTPIEVCNKTKEHVINTFETILNEKSNNLDQNSSEQSAIPEVSNITNEHGITTLNENSQESIKTNDIKFEESRIPEVSNKTKEQFITTLHEESNQMDGIKSENSTIPEVLSKTIDRDGITTIETTLNKDSQENKREESEPEDSSNTIDRDDVTTHEMMPNEDSQESKENKREQLQSIETCANITTDSKQMNTTENRPNQLKEDFKPLLSSEENIKNSCSPSGQSMEVQLDTQSIAEDDAMDIDNDLESEIKASLESNKRT